MELWVAGSHSDLGVLDQLYVVLHAVPQVILSVLCFRLLNQLHLNLPISLHECFKYLLATHGRKDHDRVIFYFKLTCNLEDNITHLESKYTGHLSSSWWHSHIFSQHKSKEKLDETSLCCPAVAILTSRRYCSHLYCTAYSQRKQSGGLKIKPNGVIKKKKKKPQYEKCTTTNRLTVLLHCPVGVNKLAYYKMREDTLLRLSLHCFVDLWIANLPPPPPILPGCAIISCEQCLLQGSALHRLPLCTAGLAS